MTISIYTSGACKGNGQQSHPLGGWGAVLDNNKGLRLHLAGHIPNTTNQQTELTAAITALKTLNIPHTVNLYTHSEYLKKGLTEWLENWKSNGWVNSQGKPVANAELWRELDDLMKIHQVKLHWVKKNTGGPSQKQAKQLANKGASGKTIKQYQKQAPRT